MDCYSFSSLVKLTRWILFLLLIGLNFSNVASGAVYLVPSPGNDVIGQVFTIQIQHGDTINKLMRQYEVSYHELVEANPGIKPKYLREGSELLIPTEFVLPKYRKGIVINTAELRLYYFTDDGQYVFTTPVGLGRDGWRTPTMITAVSAKEENPIWHVPKEIAEYAFKTKGKIMPEEIPPGPDNPLGNYALYLASGEYMLHGTNNQNTVGMYYSSGCMRFYDDAIRTLYEIVSIGTPVYIIHHPNKVGWLDGILYLQSHVPVSSKEEDTKLNTRSAKTAINEATSQRPASIDWSAVSRIEQQETGVPQPIGEGKGNGNNYYDFGVSNNAEM